MTALVPFNIPITNYQTGIPLPGATVTVYKTGTNTKASIYDLTGAARANPMTVDATGLIQFQAIVGQICDVQWSLGAYTSPRLMVGGDASGILSILAVIPELYGAVGDGVADDKTPIENACASLGASGGIVLLSSFASYYVSSLSIPAGCFIRGTMERPDYRLKNTSTGLVGLPGISLDSSGTILLGDNAGITNTFVKRSGITFPAADSSAFAGSGISLGGDGCVVRNCLVVGFNKVLTVDAGLAFASRFTIDGLWGDGKNGIYLDKPSYDSSWIVNCHMYPFCSLPLTGAALVRPGSGYYFRGAQDDTHLDNCLEYGYKYGFDLAGTGSMNAGKIWADYPPTLAAANSSVGLLLGANTTNVTISDLQIWGPNKGIYSTQNNTETLQVGNCIISSTASHAIETTGGELYVSNTKLNAIGGDCFKINNSGSHVFARGYALSFTGMLVNAVTGGFPNFIDVQMGTNPFNTPDGTDLVGGVAITPYTVASAATMALPANGSEFAVSGTAAVNTINGKWGGREATLTFTGTASLTQAGNIRLATTTFQGAAGSWIRLRWDTAISKWVELYRGPTPVSAIPLRGHIGGLVLSNNAGTPNTKLDVAAGEATDSTVFTKMSTAGATLDITTSGVALGLDTGTRANNTWYHVYLIAKADGTTTIVASTSASSPALLSGYLYYRRIGSFLTDGSSNIVPFLQLGDTVRYLTSYADVATANMGTTNALYALTVPLGVRTRPIFDMGSSTASVNLIAFDGDLAGFAPGSGNMSVSPGYMVSGGTQGSVERVTDVATNTSRQVRIRSNVSTAELYVYTRGYIDTRERFD